MKFREATTTASFNITPETWASAGGSGNNTPNKEGSPCTTADGKPGIYKQVDGQLVCQIQQESKMSGKSGLLHRFLEDGDKVPCPNCNGSGGVYPTTNDGTNTPNPVMIRCEFCGGSGFIVTDSVGDWFTSGLSPAQGESKLTEASGFPPKDPIINKNGVTPKDFWSYHSDFETPNEAPPSMAKTSSEEWQSLSPGMRREIWRMHNKTVASKESKLTEAVTLRFSSPSRTQLAKQSVYYDVLKRQRGLGKVKVTPITGKEGEWSFDVSSLEANQFLTPSKLSNILVSGVSVSQLGAVATPQNASQDKSKVIKDPIREKIRGLVEKKLTEEEKKSKFSPGDKIGYSSDFLRNTGQHIGNAPQRRGTFLSHDSGVSPDHVRVRWDDEKDHHAYLADMYGQDYLDDVIKNGSTVHHKTIAKVGSTKF